MYVAYFGPRCKIYYESVVKLEHLFVKLKCLTNLTFREKFRIRWKNWLAFFSFFYRWRVPVLMYYIRTYLSVYGGKNIPFPPKLYRGLRRISSLRIWFPMPSLWESVMDRFLPSATVSIQKKKLLHDIFPKTIFSKTGGKLTRTVNVILR